ncbi:MAG: hypothetical protein PQJ60_01575, partial [Spirochaetales bacterium]|nr:hypothetical protein [Spirochaetales bacterium]
MKKTGFSLKTKLLLSFSLVLILAVLVGVVGIVSLESLKKQNIISGYIKDSLTGTQHAQAAALRFALYEEEEYIETIHRETEEVYHSTNQALDLVKKGVVADQSRALLKTMEEYQRSIEAYYDLRQQKEAAGNRRAEAAAVVSSDLESIFKTDIDPHVNRYGIDSDYLPAYRKAQELSHSWDRVYIKAYRYLLTQKATDLNLWIEEIDHSADLVNQCLALFESESLKGQFRSIGTHLQTYRENVVVFKELNDSQAAELIHQKEAA